LAVCDGIKTCYFGVINWTRAWHRTANLYASSSLRVIAKMTDTLGLLSLFPTSRQTPVKPNMTLGPLFVSTPILLAYPSIVCQGSSLSHVPCPFAFSPTPRLCDFYATASRPRLPTRAEFSSDNFSPGQGPVPRDFSALFPQPDNCRKAYGKGRTQQCKIKVIDSKREDSRPGGHENLPRKEEDYCSRGCPDDKVECKVECRSQNGNELKEKGVAFG
jgi:hypothetical protein